MRFLPGPFDDSVGHSLSMFGIPGKSLKTSQAHFTVTVLCEDSRFALIFCLYHNSAPGMLHNSFYVQSCRLKPSLIIDGCHKFRLMNPHCSTSSASNIMSHGSWHICWDINSESEVFNRGMWPAAHCGEPSKLLFGTKLLPVDDYGNLGLALGVVMILSIDMIFRRFFQGFRCLPKSAVYYYAALSIQPYLLQSLGVLSSHVA